MKNKTVSSSNTTVMKYLSAILIALVTVDGILTNLLIKYDIAREGNPFLKVLAGEGIFLAVKLVGAILCVLLLWDIYRHWHKLAFISICFFVGIYAVIVGWNMALLIIS
ncbi:MAG: DUF5658 family protein [Dehalococcoidales bacterium]|nr:DUF5658 family protein [Dehalococcoidales bacterium]